MTTFSRPLVGLSLTDPDHGLLHYAARLAEKVHWTDIRYAHVVPPDRATEWNPQSWEDQLRAEVARLYDGPALDTRQIFHVAQGSRIDELLALAARHECDLVLLGHRRMRSGRRSLARRMAMVAPSSVWLVPEGAPSRISNVLVPIDFSKPSADSLAVAANIARAAGLTKIHALHVYFSPSTIRFDEHREEILGQEEQHFEVFLKTIETHGVEVEPVFQESTHPPEAILRVAERLGSDLIVMGTRGRSQAAFVLLGSTTSAMMAATSVPLLAVKHYGSHMSLLEALRNHNLWLGDVPKTN